MRDNISTTQQIEFVYRAPMSRAEKRLESAMKYYRSKYREIPQEVLTALKIASGVNNH